MAVPRLLVILGATASGKTNLAVQLASVLDGEIISADSRQVFKHMDIGTGKDLNSYQVKGNKIPYHLIDILEPGERYHVDAFKNDFYKAFQAVTEKNKLPILCGGTGLYIQNILQNQIYTAVPNNMALRGQLENLDKDALILQLGTYAEETTKHVDLSSKKRLIRAIEVNEFLKYNDLEVIERPKFKPLVIGLKNEVEITRKNIISRLNSRLESGMIAEVESLLRNGISHNDLIFYGLEYKFISNYIVGLITYDELKLKLGIAICQFAKRQNTYFRKMEKDGIRIIWLNAQLPVLQLSQMVIDQLKDENFKSEL